MSRRIAATLAALHGFAGVAVSALGAHTVSAADYRAVMTGAAMQIAHALAALAAIALLRGSVVAWGFVIGAALFAGAIDLRVFAGIPAGPVAPIGGTILMLAWLGFAALSFNKRGTSTTPLRGWSLGPGSERAGGPHPNPSPEGEGRRRG